MLKDKIKEKSLMVEQENRAQTLKKVRKLENSSWRRN